MHQIIKETKIIKYLTEKHLTTGEKIAIDWLKKKKKQIVSVTFQEVSRTPRKTICLLSVNNSSMPLLKTVRVSKMVPV